MSVQKSLRRAHASSIIISCVINGALIFALLTLIQFSENTRSPSTQIELSPPSETEEIEEPEELDEPDPIEDLENMDFTTEFQFDTPQETELDTPEEPVDQPTDTNVAEMADLMTDVASPVTMSGVMFGRTAAGRAALISRYGGGGGKLTEAAVTRALEWLARVQEKDGKHKGAWLKDGEKGQANTGMTGLALLTFLAHGETPSSAKYGENVANGIRYLIENQDSAGIFQPAGAHTGYGHAMATYAIAEAYTMTQNPLLEEPLVKAIDVIIDGMQENGGFDYDYKQSGRSDNSVNAWHVQAMKAARIAGVGGDRLRVELQKAMDGMLALSKEYDEGLAFGYSSPGKHAIVTAAGGLCLHLAGRGESREAKHTIEYIEERFMDGDTLPEWGRPSASEHGGEINLWYYAIQALFHDDPGGSSFKKYMAEMAKALIKNQEADGKWVCFTDKGKKHGPVYNTTLAALAMMVYYRHLPTNQAENIESYQPGAAEEVQPVEEPEVEFKISMF